ncbi:MAG: glutamine amidotransferase [Armatimonadota bacterium]
MKQIVLLGLAFFLLGMACVYATSAPLVITAAELTGEKAHLGSAQQSYLVLGDQPLVIRRELPPGRISVRAWLRYNGKGSAFRMVSYTLAVGDVSGSQTVDAIDSGQTLACELLHKEGGLTITLARGHMPPEAVSELKKLKGNALGNLDDPEKGPDDLGDVKLPAAENNDASASPVPMVLFDRLEIIPLSGPIIISGIRSDRVTYAPGAKGTVTITLANLSEKSENGTLNVNLAEDLLAKLPLFKGEVTVAANGTLEKTFPVEVGTQLWGRGVETQLETKSGTDRGGYAFGIITNPWMLALHGRGLAQFGSQYWTAEEAVNNTEAIAAANLANGNTIYEAFAWAPCDYSKMTIDNDAPFYSGQTQYSKSRMSLKTLHQTFHKYGLEAVTYGKTCACGLPGMEYALRHPDQMNVFGPAGFAHEGISEDFIDRMLEGRYRQHGKDEDFWQCWMSAWTAIGNLDAVNFGVDEIARSAKQFEWDAVRYDGHFNAWQDPAMSARVVKYAADRLRKQVPGFGIGYNYMGPQHSTPQGAFGDAELAACAHGGGQIMTEYYRGILGNVRDNIEHLRWGGDAVRLHGGYWLAIIDDNSPWNAALVFASGARPMSGNDSFNKFAMRFSSYILDPSMRRLMDPSRVVKPAGKADFLWDSFIYEKPLGKDKATLIMQLVNVGEGFSFHPNNRPPTGVNPPQANVEFQLSLPAGYTAESVFACDDYHGFTPQAATLTGNRLTIPRVAMWTMVVVTLKKANPGQSLAEVCTVPVVFDGKETISQEEFRAQLKIGAEFGPQTAEKVKEGKFFITPEVLQAIFKQGDPVSAAPGEKAYQPADFTTHRDGVDRALSTEDTPITLLRNGKPDIHFARGIFSHLDRLEEAFAQVKEARLTTSSLDDGRQACGAALNAKNVNCLTDYPSPETLARTDILVLDEVPATSFSVAQRRQIRSFVENGGSLLVLGGWYALSKGNYEGSFLEEVLPVTTVQRTYLRRLRGADQVIKPTADYAALLGAPAPSFGAGGAVEWINHIQLKPGAKVLLTAGAHPLLIAGTFGKGRVVVFTGSHSGEPAAPYWTGQAWPAVMVRVMRYLTAGSEVVSPLDARFAERITKTSASLDQMEKESPESIAEKLQFLLTAQTEQQALYVATYLLENSERVPPEKYNELIDGILPFISASAGWNSLGERYQEEPPPMLNRLVAEVAAVAVKGLTFAAIKAWGTEIDEVTRLRCIAACKDAAALPYLRDLDAKLTRQEKTWNDLIAKHEQSGSNAADMYKTRLLRPYVAYARIRCGERNEETLAALCHGMLDLPYYAWRQRWILDGAYNSLVDAGRTGDPNSISNMKARISAMQRVVKNLDLAVTQAALLFRPEVIGRDDIGKRAAARALRDVDCRKALPLCLAYLGACTSEELKAMTDVQTAKLDSVRFFYQARMQPGAER